MSEVAEWEINADLAQAGCVGAYAIDHALDAVCYMMGIYNTDGPRRDIKFTIKDGCCPVTSLRNQPWLIRLAE